jgi:hypothetical protein
MFNFCRQHKDLFGGQLVSTFKSIYSVKFSLLLIILCLVYIEAENQEEAYKREISRGLKP